MSSSLVLKGKQFMVKSYLTYKYGLLSSISTHSVQCLDHKWRKERDLPFNHTSFGPLTNLPDYTYLDGRPTPLGANQKKRLMKQRGYAETIIRLTKEVDFAVERHERLKREEEERKQNIINNKLKPKGYRFLK